MHEVWDNTTDKEPHHHPRTFRDKLTYMSHKTVYKTVTTYSVEYEISQGQTEQEIESS